MRYLLSIWDNNKKAMSTNLDEFTEFINSYGPVDILIAPETNKVKDIKNRLGLEHSFIVRKINFAIISKYPILDAGYLETGVSDRAGGWADLDVNGKTVRLYGLYLQTNKITVETNDIVKEADLKQKKFWQNIQTIISRYRKSAPQRVAQAKLVKEHAADCTHPILICGDFNDTPNSHIYHLLSKDMQDAFKVKGSGIGTTFTGNIPTLRIDFILANDDFAVKNFHTIENKFSDHKLIFADLEILL